LLIAATERTDLITPLKSAFSTDLSKNLESSEILEKHVAKTKEEDSKGESGGKTASPFHLSCLPLSNAFKT
jgi:hypothetical protein